MSALSRNDVTETTHHHEIDEFIDFVCLQRRLCEDNLGIYFNVLLYLKISRLE